MWVWVTMKPGMTIRPEASSPSAPGYLAASAALSPTSTMAPSRTATAPPGRIGPRSTSGSQVSTRPFLISSTSEPFRPSAM